MSDDSSDNLSLSLSQTEAKLLFNMSSAPSRPCAGPHAKPVNVEAVFDPAFCHNHRHMDINVHKAGWCYITSQEAQLLTLMRQTTLIDQMIVDLTEDIGSGRLNRLSHNSNQ